MVRRRPLKAMTKKGRQFFFSRKNRVTLSVDINPSDATDTKVSPPRNSSFTFICIRTYIYVNGHYLSWFLHSCNVSCFHLGAC